jgi:DNA-binding NtrC family response regulator
MDSEPVRVWFCGWDELWANRISQALGCGYSLRVIRARPDTAADQSCEIVLFEAGDHPGEGSSPVDDTWEQLLNYVRTLDVPPPIVALLRGSDRGELGCRFLEKGAYDCVSDPEDPLELCVVVRHALQFRTLQKQLFARTRVESQCETLDNLVTDSEVMQRVVGLVRRVAPCDVNVLISGETGTGKEVIASAIHRLSPRANHPFVAFSCANLPEALVEDELFGHEKGAFTGASYSRRGRFEAADHGTLFMDEIGDLAPSLQAKLLRVLQERSFERLGSNAPVRVNIRLICATHQNLSRMVKEGSFREDLYYRLKVMQIHLPPLRERRSEIPTLAHHFLWKCAKQFKKPVTRFSPAALLALDEYSWPGNVREMENVVQHAVVMAEGSVINLSHLTGKVRAGFDEDLGMTEDSARRFDTEVRDFKRRLITRTLTECGGNKAKAARKLGLGRTYLHRLIEQFEIGDDDSVPARRAG